MEVGGCERALSKSTTQFVTIFYQRRYRSKLDCLVPSQIKLQESPQNPALAPQRLTSKTDGTNTLATGAKREYLSPQASPESVGFPPRPVPGCMIDFDEILRHCAYEAGKVRGFQN